MKNNITTKRLNQLKGKHTLRKFADIVGLGQSTLHNYLKGRDLKLSMAVKIARATGCDLNWLAGIDDVNNVNLNLALKNKIITLKEIYDDIEQILNSGPQDDSNI